MRSGNPKISWSINQSSHYPLTLIRPGEFKDDLANFDLKLQENLLSTLFSKNTYFCSNVWQIFFVHTQCQKMT
jgi:hypothetical protein